MTTAVSEKYCLTLVKIVHQNFNKRNDVESFQENLFSIFLTLKVAVERTPKPPNLKCMTTAFVKIFD